MYLQTFYNEKKMFIDKIILGEFFNKLRGSDNRLGLKYLPETDKRLVRLFVLRNELRPRQ